MKKSIRHKGAKIRMCAACGLRARKDETEYLRIVHSKDGTISVDREGTLPGRGAYVCRSADCVRKIYKTRRLSHLLRGAVPETLYEELRKEVGIDG